MKKDLTKEDLHSGEEYFSFGEDSREAPEPPSAVILPEFDSLMMGYKDKSRFLSQDTVKKVSGGRPAVNRTTLVDGLVPATWQTKKNAAGLGAEGSPRRRRTARVGGS